VPARKHSEQTKEEKLIPMKKGSNNSIMSRSTQSSYGSSKVLSEKNLSYAIEANNLDKK
jgi:hypothetical protein